MSSEVTATSTADVGAPSSSQAGELNSSAVTPVTAKAEADNVASPSVAERRRSIQDAIAAASQTRTSSIDAASEIDADSVQSARRSSLSREQMLLSTTRAEVESEIRKEIRTQMREKSGEWYEFAANTAKGYDVELEKRVKAASDALADLAKEDDKRAAKLKDLAIEVQKADTMALEKVAALKKVAENEIRTAADKMEALFESHLAETRKVAESSLPDVSVKDSDIKMLGPRLKQISDAVLKNHTERDSTVRDIELAFARKFQQLKESYSAREVEMKAECKRKTEELESSLGELRSETQKQLDEARDDHKKQMAELKEGLEEKHRLNMEEYRKNEEAFKLKQTTILSALKKSASEEQERQMGRSLDNMEKAAKDAITRQRALLDVERKGEAAAAKRFDALVESMQKKWKKEEDERARLVEEQVRSEMSIEVKNLKAELLNAKKLAEETQKKWADISHKQQTSHSEAMSEFASKCRKTYDDRLIGITEKMEKQFNMYEKQLLNADKDLTEQTMQFENRLHAMKLACNEWKDEYANSMDAKHAEALTALEARYMKEIDKLLDQVAGLQKIIKEEKRISPGSSRARMDGLLANFLKMRKALDLGPNEQLSLLMKLLQSADFSPRLLEVYSELESKLSDQLPIKRMVTRREFVKYRLQVIKRFGENPATTGGGNTEELESEFDNLNSTIYKSLENYEGSHGVPFIYEGRIYRDILEEERAETIMSATM